MRVLIVDDCATMRLTLRQMVAQALGIQALGGVMVACDGGQALQHLADLTVALVVTDYDMPGMDGLEFVRKFRMLDRHTPVLMLTGAASPGLQAAALLAGVNLVLAKPLDAMGLAQAVALARRVESQDRAA